MDEKERTPQEAIAALKTIREILGSVIISVFLTGSAVMGRLRPESDVDILVLTNQALTAEMRKRLTMRMLKISGKIGNKQSVRPLEVTVVCQKDIVPWRYPPKRDFIYGEWLRTRFENGLIQEPEYSPDLAVFLAQARDHSVSLYGRSSTDILDLVPMSDIRLAIKAALPELILYISGDERNVILTLARMWFTLASGRFAPKDVAAEWAIPLMPQTHRKYLDLARKGYLGEQKDSWTGLEKTVFELVGYMKQKIESL